MEGYVVHVICDLFGRIRTVLNFSFLTSVFREYPERRLILNGPYQKNPPSEQGKLPLAKSRLPCSTIFKIRYIKSALDKAMLYES